MKDLEYWKELGYVFLIEPVEGGYNYRINEPSGQNIYINFAETIELTISRSLEFLEYFTSQN